MNGCSVPRRRGRADRVHRRTHEVVGPRYEAAHDIRRQARVVQRHRVGVVAGRGTPTHTVAREVRQWRAVRVGRRRRPAQRRRPARDGRDRDAEGGKRRGRGSVADSDHDVAVGTDVARSRRALQATRRRAERGPWRSVRDRERQRVAVRVARRGLKRIGIALHHGRQRRARYHRRTVRNVAHDDRERRELRSRLSVADSDHDVAVGADVARWWACPARRPVVVLNVAHARPIRDRCRSTELPSGSLAVGWKRVGGALTDGRRRRARYRWGTVRDVAYDDRERRELRGRLAVADADHDVAESADVGARRRTRETTGAGAERSPARPIRDAVRQRVAVGIRRIRRERVLRRRRMRPSAACR